MKGEKKGKKKNEGKGKGEEKERWGCSFPEEAGT